MCYRCAVRCLLLVAACIASACDATCPHTFEVLSTFTFDEAVPCCETTMRKQPVVIRADDAEVDVAVHQDPTIAARVDAWLTPASCLQLFDPGSSVPKCEVLIGPVAAGSVSARRKAPAGDYHVFVRPRDAGTAPVAALVDVRVWGARCLTRPAS